MLRRQNPFWQAMPFARRSGIEALPDAWRRPGIGDSARQQKRSEIWALHGEAIAERRQAAELIRKSRKLLLKLE